MKNDEINSKVIRHVRERIAASNLEKEYKMNRNFRRKIMSLSMILIFIFAGGFITVDAVNNGEISDKIVDTIHQQVKKVWVVRANGDKEEIEVNVIKYEEDITSIKEGSIVTKQAPDGNITIIQINEYICEGDTVLLQPILEELE